MKLAAPRPAVKSLQRHNTAGIVIVTVAAALTYLGSFHASSDEHMTRHITAFVTSHPIIPMLPRQNSQFLFPINLEMHPTAYRVLFTCYHVHGHALAQGKQYIKFTLLHLNSMAAPPLPGFANLEPSK